MAERQARYSTGAIILHWATAACMLLQVALGLTMGEGHSALSFARFQLHKSVGITILLLTVLRIIWRIVNKPPLSTVGGWEGRLAKTIHGLFYALLLILPLTGWLMVSVSPSHIPTLLYGVVPWPNLPGFTGMSHAQGHAIDEAAGTVHAIAAYLAIAAILLHVAGALKHQLFDHDGTFARMAPGARPGFDGRLVVVLVGALAAVLLGLFVRPPVPAARQTAPELAEAPAPKPLEPPAAPQAAPIRAPAPAATPSPAATPAPSASPTADAGALADWKVQRGGRLGFATTWSGNALSGSFTDWTADIAFGEVALDKSHVKVTVKTGSAHTGQDQPDSTLPSDDWFATAMFPTATFEARKFRKTGDGRFVANGTLTLRGKSQPLSLPFTLKIDGDTARMTGSAVVDRTAYGVGFAGTDEVPAKVKLSVSLTAKKK